jgi:GGDEF domain-containing protein
VAHNRRLLDVFGIPPERLFGPGGGSLAGLSDRPLLAAVLELVAEPALFMERVAALYADPRLVDDCELALKDGRTLERHSRALYAADRQYLGRVWFFRDVSSRKRTEAALRELSRLDPLTGLANRREFFEVAKREFIRARRTGRALSFLMLDLDAFKRVNDDWGHATGDLVLKAVATCAAGALRAMDHFARIGGEEFVILAPDADGQAAFVLAERVRVRRRPRRRCRRGPHPADREPRRRDAAGRRRVARRRPRARRRRHGTPPSARAATARCARSDPIPRGGWGSGAERDRAAHSVPQQLSPVTFPDQLSPTGDS